MTALDLIRQLPEIPVVRDRCRSMAMLDAILSPEWEYRYYSFDSRWSPAEEMASMRDGCGSEYSIVFSPAGAYARGLDHESPMTPYRATARFWRGQAGTAWRAGAIGALPEGAEDDGSAGRLFDVLLDGRPEACQRPAGECHEVTADIAAVRHVYALRPLTQAIASLLNPEVDTSSLAEDLAEAGYPVRE